MPPDIAVIDSGINPDHFHVGSVHGGHGYTVDAAGRIETSPGFADEIGHGTAISGILKHKAPEADLYGIKIFEKRLSAPAAILIAALEWAIEKRFKIVHLSLGTEVESYYKKLALLCDNALERGVVIIAAARGARDEVWPAALETVIGVFWDGNCAENQISYHPGARVEFGAYGWPRKLPGMPQQMNFRGNSFAVAHVTGMVARLANQYPEAGPLELKHKLYRLADERRPYPN